MNTPRFRMLVWQMAVALMDKPGSPVELEELRCTGGLNKQSPPVHLVWMVTCPSVGPGGPHYGVDVGGKRQPPSMS